MRILKIKKAIIISIYISFYMNGNYSAKEREIGSKDIIQEDNPVYNLKKKDEKNEKLGEEYEETEYDIPRRNLQLKRRELKPADSNETLVKFENKDLVQSGSEKKNKAEIYGGSGNFLGTNIHFQKIINHGFPKKDFFYSGFGIKIKSENYDYFENHGKYILDSGKKMNLFELNGFTYFSERVNISYELSGKNSNLFLQNNPNYKKQERNSANALVTLEYMQSDRIFHKVNFRALGFELRDASRNLNFAKGLNDKSSGFKKNSAQYELNFELTNNWQIFSMLDHSSFFGEKIRTGQFPEDKNSNFAGENRFRGGVEKKENGEFLRDWIFRTLFNIHTLSNEKNHNGSEIYLAYRFRNFLFGGNFQNSGQLLDYYETYVMNDLGDLNIQFKRTTQKKMFGFVEYEFPNFLKVDLKAGRAMEIGKYIFYKSTDSFFYPRQSDVNYDFSDLAFHFHSKKYFQFGSEISIRKYERKDLPYLPDLTGSAYLRFLQNGFSIELRAYYLSNMRTDSALNGKKLGDQRRFDFLFYYAIFRKFDFRLEIRNLDDRELFYREDFRFSGRQILFGARMNF